MADQPRDHDIPLRPLSALTALGVVFGDLGTSPLYALQAVAHAVGGRFSPEAALGVLSLVVWTLLITVSLKYCVLVMRADNHGEGGIFALMSLVKANRLKGATGLLTVLGLFGAALIYGDGTITPAISVLSALEGVNLVTDRLRPFIMPLAVVILLLLFLSQRFGTAKIGGAFGPIMLAWFLLMAVLGVHGIALHPQVLSAIDPWLGIRFLMHAGLAGVGVLGGVFLCITGGEALYADMGHVGKGAIRVSWYAMVLPALLLNYAGQTAMLLSGQPLRGNPFFVLVPGWAVYPVVALATVATIIASQAIITGSFSMTRQAIQLRWLPPVPIRQTSDAVYGQIYIPIANALMMAATVGIAIGFGSSDRLAGAYGTAVSTTMLITTVLLATAMIRLWRWPVAVAAIVAGAFLVVDTAYFGANLAKIRQGGWLPLSLGAAMLVLMITWRNGVDVLRGKAAKSFITPKRLREVIDTSDLARPEGAAVFLTRMPRRVPRLLTDYIAYTGSLHRTVAIVSVQFVEAPRVAEKRRIVADEVSPGLWCVTVRFGFIEFSDLHAAMRRHKRFAAAIDLEEAVYFGARDLVVRRRGSHALSLGRLALFAFLYRNAQRVMDRFNLPPGRVLEIAREIEL